MSVLNALPPHSLYLSVGQLGPAQDRMMSWLSARRDVTVAIMLHDAIPLDYPEYVTLGEMAAHRRMVAHTATYAHGLIVSTEAARRSIFKILREFGRDEIPTSTLGLPVA